MEKISFDKNSFDVLQLMPIDKLDEEISRLSIRLKLLSSPEESERLSVLKYLARLKRGQMTMIEFEQKVQLIW